MPTKQHEVIHSDGRDWTIAHWGGEHGTVSVIHTRHHKGKNAHSGKTYSRFENRGGLVLSFKGKKPEVYRIHPKTRRNTKWIQRATPNFVSTSYMNDELEGHLSRYAHRATGKYGPHSALQRFAREAYPILHARPDWFLPYGMGPAFRKETPREFVEALFGKKNYRKDLLKAVDGLSHPGFLKIPMGARGLVPTERIIEGLREFEGYLPPVYQAPGDEEPRRVRELFRVSDQYTISHLLKDPLPRWIGDSLRQLEYLGTYGVTPEIKRLRTWRDVHDFLAGEVSAVRHKPRPIPKESDIVKKLDGVMVAGYCLKAASDTKEMQEWGRDMGHCIGAYATAAVRQDGFYFGLYKDGKLVGNMEISGGGITQIYGKHNRPLKEDSDIRKGVAEILPELDTAPTLPDFGYDPAAIENDFPF